MLRARVSFLVSLVLSLAPTAASAETGSVLERSRVTAADAAPGDGYGEAVALKGTTAVVGAPGSDVAGPSDAGAAYVLEERGGQWVQVAQLLPSVPIAGSRFGSTVAMTEDTIVVGTREPDPSPGSAYVFERSGTSWIETARLVAHDPEAGAVFGNAVAIESDTILIGAPFDDAPHLNSGAAYVFTRVGGVWAFQEKLQPRSSSVAATSYHFGTTVALLRDTAFISYPGHKHNGRNPIDVFERTNGVWDDGRRATGYADRGRVLVAEGERFAFEDNGRVVIFSRSDTGLGWSVEDQALAPDGESDDQFGYSIALSDRRLLVGARRSDLGGTAAGAVYLFERTAERWFPIDRATGSDAAQGDWFHAVALDGTRALVGAPRSDAAALDAGQAYGLALPPLQTRLEPSGALFPNPTTVSSLAADQGQLILGAYAESCFPTSSVRMIDPSTASGSAGIPQSEFLDHLGAWLGHSVAIDGDTAMAGAPRASRAQWFDHGGCVDPVRDLGRVIFYERNGDTWSEGQVIDPHYGGRLGAAVALDGDLAVAGEPWGGWPHLAGAQGRVVVFTRAPQGWRAQTAFTATDGDEYDAFGEALAMQGGVLAVGAPGLRQDTENPGAVYVFELLGTSFVQTSKLSVPAAPAGSRFGSELAMDGDTLVVAANGNPSLPAPIAPRVHVFVRSGSDWVQQAVLDPCGPFAESLGDSIALSGDRLAVTSDDSVLLFQRGGGSWILSATLRGTDRYWTPEDVVFVDDRVLVAHARGVDIFELPRSTPSFCDAVDGSLASCPCGNLGVPDAGCDTPGGQGGVRLEVVAQSETGPQRASLTATGFPQGSLASGTLLRGRFLEPGGPVVFGDGLRCLALPVTRVDAGQGTGGAIDFTVRHGPQVGPGTFFYQLHFRSTPAAYCDQTAAFNMSSGRAITWR